jgi:formyltetrahydrofolate deformylase
VSAAWGQEYVLTLSCPEKPGIVHAISGFLVQHSANILASQQYGEAPDGRFFMRVHYMQIVSPELCRQFEGRMINIHHSFLPSFKGAKPYHQAHARGVKLVGATAHYVTADLDEGPIIEQDVLRVDHGFSPERLAQAGRDVEAQVLARAVTWHAEHRVLLNGDRTVVFH